MKALVVYESMYGNTEEIAMAIAGGLAAHMEVETAEVGGTPARVGAGIHLLVIGGPTHAFGMSRPGTRKSAAEDTDREIVSKGMGIREWIDAMQIDTPRLAAATFDTKIRKPPLPGSAANAAQRRLRKEGLRIVAPAESFYVAGGHGPLLPGEAIRARHWGEAIAGRLVAVQRA
jgi:hypothetical protein